MLWDLRSVSISHCLKRRRIAEYTLPDNHKNYWREHNCQYNEFWRFEDGYRIGWDDAKKFVQAVPESSSVSELGFKERWIKHRTEQHVAMKGSSNNLWEFHAGFEQGFDTAWGNLVQ